MYFLEIKAYNHFFCIKFYLFIYIYDIRSHYKSFQSSRIAPLSTSGVADDAIMIITEPTIGLFSTLNDILRYIYMVTI